jgi:hypothetical protein
MRNELLVLSLISSQGRQSSTQVIHPLPAAVFGMDAVVSDFWKWLQQRDRRLFRSLLRCLGRSYRPK